MEADATRMGTVEGSEAPLEEEEPREGPRPAAPAEAEATRVAGVVPGPAADGYPAAGDRGVAAVGIGRHPGPQGGASEEEAHQGP